MSGWAALGAGAGFLGNAMMENEKAKMAESLEIEREKRREQYEIEKEKRQAAREEARRANTVEKTRMVKKDGAWFEQKINVNGNVMDEYLAPQSEVERANREEQKEQTSLESTLLANKLAQKKLDTFEDDAALDRRYKNASIASLEASARSSHSLADQRDATATDGAKGGMEDAVDQLIKDNSALLRQYGDKDLYQNPLMASDFRRLAKESVKAAAERGMDARTFFIDALERYMKDPNSMPNRRARDAEATQIK